MLTFVLVYTSISCIAGISLIIYAHKKNKEVLMEELIKKHLKGHSKKQLKKMLFNAFILDSIQTQKIEKLKKQVADLELQIKTRKK